MFGAFGFLFNMVTVFAYLDELFIARIIFACLFISHDIDYFFYKRNSNFIRL